MQVSRLWPLTPGLTLRLCSAFPETARWGVQGAPRGTVLCWELVYILKSESFLNFSLSFPFRRKQLKPGHAHSGF